MSILDELPVEYSIEHTGGGCQVLRWGIDDESFYWITVADDAQIPTSLTEPVLLGYYWGMNAECWRLFNFNTLAEAVSWVSAHPDGVDRDGPEWTTIRAKVIVPGVGNDDPAYS